MTSQNRPERSVAPGPRIPPLKPDELGEEARALAAQLRTAFNLPVGDIPGVVATMLRHPELYRAQIEFVAKRAKASALDPKILKLAILRTSWLCHSGYVWGEHVKMAKTLGLTSEDIERLIEGSAAPGWSEPDRAVVRAAEELHADAVVSDETWGILEKYLDEKQLIELVTMIGSYHEVAFIYNSLRVRLAPGNEGLAAR